MRSSRKRFVAIVFGCECCHSYLYAHQEVIADIFYYKGIDYLATHGWIFLQINIQKWLASLTKLVKQW